MKNSLPPLTRLKYSLLYSSSLVKSFQINLDVLAAQRSQIVYHLNVVLCCYDQRKTRCPNKRDSSIFSLFLAQGLQSNSQYNFVFSGQISIVNKNRTIFEYSRKNSKIIIKYVKYYSLLFMHKQISTNLVRRIFRPLSRKEVILQMWLKLSKSENYTKGVYSS